jgi:NADH-quinone oxidoreductase subunit N
MVARGLGNVLVLLLIAAVASGILSVLHRKRAVALAANSVLLAGIAGTALLLFAGNADFVALSIFHIYGFSLFFLWLFAVLMILVHVMSYNYSKDFESLSMLLGLSFFGMFAVVTSNSLITTILGLELISVSSSFMILLDGKHTTGAAIKMFVIGSMAVSVLSFALALVFPYNPSLSLSGLQSNAYATPYLLFLALVLFAVGLSFESSLFPFNLWIPDVYEGAQANVAALISGLNENVGFVAIITVFVVMFAAYMRTYSGVFVMLSIFTMFFGNILAMVQKNVKRMFAYSAISQADYMMVGIGSASAFGVGASIFQMLAHSFTMVGIFSLILWLESINIRTVDDYTGLHWRNGFSSLALTIFMLSLLGIPPLIGFDGKLLLFSSAIGGGVVPLAIIGIFNSFLSVYYYGGLISKIYTKREHQRLGVDRHMLVVVMVCLLVVVLAGIYPGYLIRAANSAALSLGIK